MAPGRGSGGRLGGPGFPVDEGWLDERIEVAFEHPVGISGLESRPETVDHPAGEEDIASDPDSPGGFGLGVLELLDLLHHLRPLEPFAALMAAPETLLLLPDVGRGDPPRLSLLSVPCSLFVSGAKWYMNKAYEYHPWSAR